MDSKYRIEETLSAYKRLKDVQDNASNYKRKPESSVLIKKKYSPKILCLRQYCNQFLTKNEHFLFRKKKTVTL